MHECWRVESEKCCEAVLSHSGQNCSTVASTFALRPLGGLGKHALFPTGYQQLLFHLVILKLLMLSPIMLALHCLKFLTVISNSFYNSAAATGLFGEMIRMPLNL